MSILSIITDNTKHDHELTVNSLQHELTKWRLIFWGKIASADDKWFGTKWQT